VKRVILPLLAITLLIGVWELYVQLDHVNSYDLPAPTQVARALYDNRSTLWSNFLVTAQEIIFGIAVAAIAALLAAFTMHFSNTARFALYPPLIASQAIPVVLLAPLFVLWLGFGLLPKLLVIALVSFFPLVVTTTAALQRVDPNLQKLLKTLGASRLQTFRSVELPAALPGLFPGAKLAAVFSVIGAVFAEQQGSTSGLGYLLMITQNNLELPEAYAAVAILSAFAVALFALLTVIERRALPWAYHPGR
jgi:NitT/TauT family transport system permease protein/putative hydroxymethylpyrimidine transport system permease protein